MSHPEDFSILTKVPTTYKRELNMDAKSGHYTITYHRPHFTVNHAGDLIGVGRATETHGPILADANLVVYFILHTLNLSSKLTLLHSSSRTE